jgi:uncharacterized protein (TIGR03086 family)
VAQNSNDFQQSETPVLEQLAIALEAVGVVIAGVRPGQWTAPTPCTEWDVRRVVEHLTGMNLVFTALLREEPPPRREDRPSNEDPVTVYQDSSKALLQAFGQPEALERQYTSPMGSASGAERLQIRLYDLLAHGWDLSRATGQPLAVPDGVASSSLAFAQQQLEGQSRAGRFAAATAIDAQAPALDRLAAFLGRETSP